MANLLWPEYASKLFGQYMAVFVSGTGIGVAGVLPTRFIDTDLWDLGRLVVILHGLDLAFPSGFPGFLVLALALALALTLALAVAVAVGIGFGVGTNVGTDFVTNFDIGIANFMPWNGGVVKYWHSPCQPTVIELHTIRAH